MAMHMADALLSVRTALIMLAVSAGLLLFASRKTSENFDNFNVPLAGVMGAFVFAAQMINFAIPGTGSSGHIGGGMRLAAVLGSHGAFIALSGAQRIQMDQQRIALGIAPVAADADVLRIDDDIPRLPLLRISWPCRQRLRMTLKK